MEIIASQCYGMKRDSFITFYEKNCRAPGKTLEFYIVIINKLYKTIVNGNFEYFKGVAQVLYFISELECPSRLESYYAHEDNLLNSSNIVILSCRFNQVRILNFLFDHYFKVLNNCAYILGKHIKPSAEDEFCHSAFYYALTCGNLELLESVIDKWPNLKDNSCELKDLLSSALNSAKIRNIALPDEVEMYVLHTLVTLQYNTTSSSQKKPEKVSLNEIKDFCEFLIETINMLVNKHNCAPDVDEEFIFVANHVAKYLCILKRMLRSTYDKLPWEEMEFCLMCFLSAYNDNKQNNFFFVSILNRNRIIKHLKHFCLKLKEELQNFNDKSVKDLSELPFLSRHQVMDIISKRYPPFNDLYNDHTLLRDVYSLSKIEKYLRLALHANPKDMEGKLILTRSIQVTGEYLKNTLESPNLSFSTGQLLFSALTKGTRRVIIDLRNALYHSLPLSQVIPLDDSSDYLFGSIQNDIKKIYEKVTFLLFDQKIHIVSKLIISASTFETAGDFASIIDLFQNFNIEDEIPEKPKNCFLLLEHEKINALLEQLHNKVDSNSDLKICINELKKVMKSYSTRLEELRMNFLHDMIALKGYCQVSSPDGITPHVLNKMKHIIANLSTIVKKEVAVQEKLPKVLEKLYLYKQTETNSEARDMICSIVWEIYYIVNIEFGKLKWVQKLGDKFKDSMLYDVKQSGFMREGSLRYLKKKLSELRNVLNRPSQMKSSVQHYHNLLHDKQTLVVIEMLVLDILGQMKNHLGSSSYLSDESFLLLIGKSLRNYLAHGSIVTDILSHPALVLLLNAENLCDIDLNKYKGKIKGVTYVGLALIKEKFYKGLSTILCKGQMFHALENGDLTSINEFLKKGGDLQSKSSKNWTTLHFAAKNNCSNVIEFVLGHKINPNLKNIDGQNMLHIAARFGKVDNINFILKSNILQVDDDDILGQTALHLAAAHGHFTVVTALIKKKAKTSVQDQSGSTPLDNAVVGNYLEIVDVLMKSDETSLGIYTDDLNPLHISAEKGHVELSKVLIKKFDVNSRNDVRWTPLHAAARYGHKDIVNILIENQAIVNASVIDGFTPLHYAAREGFVDIVELLLKGGAFIDKANRNHDTPLHLASGRGHAEVVKLLIKLKANTVCRNRQGMTPFDCSFEAGNLDIISSFIIDNINSIDINGRTPLHRAALKTKWEVVEYLIDQGADVSSQDDNGQTALHIASFRGDIDTVKGLLNNDAPVNVKDKKGCTELHVACANNCLSIVKLLVKSNSDVNSICNTGSTPLQLAAAFGHEEVVSFLLFCNADVNIQVKGKPSALHAAVIAKNSRIVKKLIERGADVNAKGNDNVTPLLLAVESSEIKVVRALLEKGAKVNFDINDNPLATAIRANDKDVVQLLISFGANVNIGNGFLLIVSLFFSSSDIVDILLENNVSVNARHNGQTALHFSVSSCDTQVVDSLLKHGANVDALTQDLQSTPLFLASMNGCPEVIEILLAHGADVNKKNIDGSTALHGASVSGNSEIVKILLNSDAKLSKDNENRTALELAVSRGHLEVVKCIKTNRNVNFNSSGNSGFTLLHIATQEGKLEVVKYLVDEGSNVSIGNYCGTKPIHIASRDGFLDILMFFLEKNMSINEPGQERKTPLHYAAGGGQLQIVKFLLENGAEVNALDANNASPLHFAIAFGYKEVIQNLLKHGALFDVNLTLIYQSNKVINNSLVQTYKMFQILKDKKPCEIKEYIRNGGFVNVKDSKNKAPLHYASYHGHSNAVIDLLKYGADPNIKDAQSITPLHYAVKYSHFNIVIILLSNGAIFNCPSLSGKRPFDFCSDDRIKDLFVLLDECFEGINCNQSSFLKKLKSTQNSEVIKAVMASKNTENCSLVVLAMKKNYSRLEDLKLIGQKNFGSQFALAQEYMSKENYTETLQILKSLWRKRTEILGPSNPGTWELEIHISRALFQLGNYKEALNFLENTFKSYEGIFGSDYQVALSIKSFIALIMHKLEKNEEALLIFKDVSERQKKLLGANHSDYLETQFHMALVLRELQYFEEALKINRDLYEIRKKEFGKNNQITVITLNNVALVLSNMKKYQEALKIYEEVHGMKAQLFGKQHSTTLRTLSNIAEILPELKRYVEAFKLLQQILSIQREKFGEFNQDTLHTQYLLGNLFLKQGKLKNALKTYEKILEPVEAVYGEYSSLAASTVTHIDITKKTLSYHYNELDIASALLEEDLLDAVRFGDNHLVNKLITKRVNVNCQDDYGRTPLHYAVSLGHKDVTESLLKVGADITVATYKGNTVLHAASLNGKQDILLTLLKLVDRNTLSGFINSKTYAKGNTALHVAAEKGHMGIVINLLKYGASYNIQNEDKCLPINTSKKEAITNLLLLADEVFKDAKSGNIGLIEKLKVLKSEEFKAVTGACNRNGHTLLQIAIQQKHTDLVNQLIRLLKK